jgi:hypothetical protein
MVGMDPARSAAARDRAERHVYEAVPDLGAVQRRALALAALAEVPRAGVASEIGLSGAELSAALADARKALRRTRTQLASGGRCERAERALSDRLDGVLAPMEERFLGAHLRRCARCREHERELAAAVEALRAGFAAPRTEGTLPAVRERAQLRVVPPAPQLPPAPAEPPAPLLEKAAPPEHRRRAALPVAVAVLIAVGLVAAAIALLSAFDDDSPVRAPWDTPNAPIVHPPPISDQ